MKSTESSARHGTRSFLAVAVAAAILIPAAVSAQQAAWFHLTVDEPGETTVNLKLPLSLVEMGLDLAGKDAVKVEHLRWSSDRKVSLDDIRRMWVELRESGDEDFVEVVENDTHVRISIRGEVVLVSVDEGDDTSVRVEVPSAIIGALLGTEGEELDLRAAIRQLARSGGHDLIDIRDGDVTVRAWIAER